jgi:chaperonin GroES
MAQSKIHPVSGYILIKPLKRAKTTASGIVLPESNQDKPQEGLVISVGSEYISDYGTKKTSPCATGDTVIYREWGGKEYKEDQEDLLLLKFEDIMAVIK